MMHSQKFKKMFPKVYKSMGRDTEQGVVVVGGGAAGMAAAIAASRQGATVTVLERMHRVGKKLLATGNGRCNFTNSDLSIDHYHGGNPQFILDVLNQFHLSDTLSFFEKLGVEPVVENDGYIYPASGQSSSVLDVLRYEMNRLGVEVVCDTKIDRVEKIGAGYQCRSSDGTVYSAASVILATGGKSYPNLGSNGSGLKIAERIGHKVREPFPALVQVVLDAPFLKRLSGLRIKGRAQSFINGKVCSSERGELLFTDYGLSGIPILQISRSVSLNAKTGYPMGIHLDLFPDTPLQQLASLISKRITHDPHKTIEMSFVGLLHKRLITVILKEAGFDSMDRLCGTLTHKEIDRLANLLKNWPLRCIGVKSWMFSQVTAGGVALEEVSSRTLESKISPSVFFAGEILDVDGECGGYNLQWAWSSGYVAGKNAGARKSLLG